MVPIRLELNRKRKHHGIGEFAIAHADWRRLESEYIGFVRQVLGVLEAERPGVQQVLPLSSLSVSVKRYAGKSKFSQPKSPRRYKTLDVPIDEKTSAQVKRAWDAKLRASYDVYSAVRRFLWRHVVHGHQACIASAAAHFWWNMDGESTAAFCPVAGAFIRWRMHWEACGTPRYLFSPMLKDPMGLGGWLASEAPICLAGWNKDSEQWVSDHVLGSHCIGSFWEFLEKSLANVKRNKVSWSKHTHTGRYTSYWAVTGRDTAQCPIRIYEQIRPPFSVSESLRSLPRDRQHRNDHTCPGSNLYSANFAAKHGMLAIVGDGVRLAPDNVELTKPDEDSRRVSAVAHTGDGYMLVPAVPRASRNCRSLVINLSIPRCRQRLQRDTQVH